jgi:hypothetical protein
VDDSIGNDVRCHLSPALFAPKVRTTGLDAPLEDAVGLASRGGELLRKREGISEMANVKWNIENSELRNSAMRA